MNVLEHYVTEIIGEPYYDDYGSGNYHWWLKVKALCYGSECETTLMFDSKEEALAIKKVIRSYLNMSEIEFRIAEILGRSAIENDMEVPKDVQQLAQATRYLATQLRIICKTEIGDEKIADVILKQAIDILK